MTEIETLAWGYGLLEGPRADGVGNLYFADVPRGGVYCRRPDGTIDTIVPKRRGVGGIALHEDGGVVVSGRDISHVRDGVTRVLFAPDAPGLNDLFVDSAGRVLCGTLRSHLLTSTGTPTPGECWRIDAEGVATELYGGLVVANGIGFSPDGTVLYHSDTYSGVWAHAYTDGAVSDRRLFITADAIAPDGLAVSEDGTVWVADVSGSGAVRAFSPQGAELARVEVPAKLVTSLCFGGADRRDLYIVTADNSAREERKGTIYRTRVDVPGCAVAYARI